MGADVIVDAHVQIHNNQGSWWLNITGSLFGPYGSEDEAIDAIPDALRDTF